MKNKQIVVTISSTLNTPFLLKLFNGSVPPLPFSSQFQYRWDITDEDFTTPMKGITLKYRPIGGSTYADFEVDFITTGASGVVAALNTLHAGMFATIVIAGRTYIIGFSDAWEFGNLKIDNIIAYQLTNFLDNPVPSAPFGLFHTDESFISIAADNTQAANFYNADPVFNTIAKAFPDPNNSTGLLLRILDDTVTLPDIKALRYWQVTNLGGASTIATSNGSYHMHPNGTVVKTDTYTLGTYGLFGMDNSALSTGNTIKNVDITSPYRNVAVDTGINRIFHNETGEWLWFDVFGAFQNISGYIPPTLRFVAVQSFWYSMTAGGLVPTNFTNWFEATQNVEAIAFNNNFIPPLAPYVSHMRFLKAYWILEIGYHGDFVHASDWGANSTNFPDLINFTYRSSDNNAVIFTLDDCNGFPACIHGFDIVGAQIESSAELDELLNAFAANWIGAVATATAKIGISQNPSRTSASDAAVATLTAQGFGFA